jgi:beta-N-acetylhexosaminidase
LSSNATCAPVIFGCAGKTLTANERALFAATRPLGFILFKRNLDHPAQVAALVADLRDAAGRSDAPVLIDQEGGRVARLGPPHWRRPPPAGAFADLHAHDEARGLNAAWLNARAIAHDLHSLGIDVDCAPVLDLLLPDAHDVIGDRAYGATPARVIALGRAVCDGLLAGGVLPVIKHMPGHGRALADSHHELPVVRASEAELEADFAPFRALADAPLAMTAHIVYPAYDPDRPASTSAIVIDRIIRGAIGFDGVLLSDDINMSALQGSIAERAVACLAAGCDVALHCSGRLDEMQAVAAALPPMTADAARRLDRALAQRRAPGRFDPTGSLARLDAMLQMAS